MTHPNDALMNTQQIEQLGQQADAMFSYAAWIGPMGLMLLGAALWLGGRRIARHMGVMAAMIVGAGVAVLAVQSRGQSAVMVAATIGALLGGVMAWVLFRIWMAAALALVLAAALPLAALALQGIAPPLPAYGDDARRLETADPDDSPAADTPEKLAADLLEQLRQAVASRGAPKPRPDSDVHTGVHTGVHTDTRADQTHPPGRDARSMFDAWWDSQRIAIDQWWLSLSTPQRGTAVTLAALGALLGILLGLVAPYTSAAIQSALIGGVLVAIGLARIGQLQPEGPLAGLLPRSPVQMVSFLGLITLVGVGLQWTLWRRRADK
jgi:hypothetical protein